MNGIEILDKEIAGGIIAGAADEKMIKAAEAKLEVHFPASYRQFLSRFGAVTCPGFRIAGLFVCVEDIPPMWFHVVAINDGPERKSGLIPMEYIAISSDGTDYMYYLDTSRLNSDDECPVVVLGPGAEDVVVAENFVEFVIRGVNNQIEF